MSANSTDSSDRIQPPARRVLGDVSPNVHLASVGIGLLKQKGNKPKAGSPLKRSFTAMMENEAGFTYLKRRRLSEDKALSDEATSQSQSQGRSVFSGMETGERQASFRSQTLSPPTPGDQVWRTHAGRGRPLIANSLYRLLPPLKNANLRQQNLIHHLRAVDPRKIHRWDGSHSLP